MDSEFSYKLEVKVGMHQGSALSPLPYAVVADIITELAKGVTSRLLYADDLVLMRKTIKGLKNKHRKVILGKTKVMISAGITKNG